MVSGMNIPRSVTLAALAALLWVSTPNAEAAVVQIGSDPGFPSVIDFDGLSDDVDVLDQFAVSDGVRFRNQLSSFAAPSGGAPGETDNEGAFSAPNFLDVEENDTFVLFETPVTQVGAYVRPDEFEDGGSFILEAFDSALQSLGSVSVAADSNWVFLGLMSDMGPIATVRFAFVGDDDDEYGLDNLGFAPVPLPGALPLFLTALAAFGLISRQRRRRHNAA